MDKKENTRECVRKHRKTAYSICIGKYCFIFSSSR